MAIGMRGHIAYGPHGNWPNSMYFLPFVSESISTTKEPLVVNNIRGRVDEGDIVEGWNTAGGDIVCEPTPIHAKRFLQYFLNQSSGSLIDSHYSHVIKAGELDDYRNDTNPISIMVYKDAQNWLSNYKSELFQLSWVNNINLDFTANGLAQMTIGVVAWQGEYVNSAYTPTYDVDKEYSWQASTSGLGHQSAVTGLSISMNNNLEVRRTIGTESLTAADLVGVSELGLCHRTAPRTIEISGAFGPYDQLINSSFIEYADIDWSFTLAGPAISSGYTGSMVIDMPKTKITEINKNIAGPGMIETNYSGKCQYDQGSGHQIKFTIQNTAVY